MEDYVKENDLVVLDVITNGTSRVSSACDDPTNGQWYCVTHWYRCPKDVSFFDTHIDTTENGVRHLVGWVCDKHGIEVP